MPDMLVGPWSCALPPMLLRLLSFGICVATVESQFDGVEIEFEPMGDSMSALPKELLEHSMGPAPPKELLELLSGGGPGGDGNPFGGVSRDHKEAKLDGDLNAVLGQMLRGSGASMPGRNHMPPPNFIGGGPFGPLGGSSQVFMQDSGGGPVIMEIDGPPQLRRRPGHSAFPAAAFRDLFPGPMVFGGLPEHPQPFDEPDPLVQNIVQDMDKTFLGLMNNIQKAASADRTPNSCGEDIKKHCQDPVEKGTSGWKKPKSNLHCLGQHAESISDACHKDIGKSVPFRCSREIDQNCDVMEVGILTCLGDHVADLGGECRDAVLATHHIISKANTQKAAVIDKATGVKQVSEPHPSVTAPPPVQGAPPVHSSTWQLPSGVMSLLGVSQSYGGIPSDATWSQSSSRMWLGLAAVVVVAAVVHWMPVTAWPKRKLLLMLPKGQPEVEPFVKGASPIAGSTATANSMELPAPVDRVEMEPATA